VAVISHLLFFFFGIADIYIVQIVSAARYQGSMLRSLKEVQGDDGVVGFYIATSTGTFLSSSLVDMQALHQERLRQGGIIIVHGMSQLFAFCRFQNSQVIYQMYCKPRTATPPSALSALQNLSLTHTSATTLVLLGSF
jgi:hypothetical protein